MLPTARAIAVLIVLLSAAALAQPEPRVYKERIEPHWSEGRTRFWYRNDLKGGAREFILVDAEKGTREPAFDTARLAASLSKALNTNIDADRLPVENIHIGKDGAMRIAVRGKAFELNRQTYDLKPATANLAAASAGLSSLDRPHPSRRTGDETSITFINQTAAEINLFWIDTEGQRRQYGSLAPNAQRDQHTFAGHVWLAADKAGKVLGIFEAKTGGGLAILGGKTAPPPPAPKTDPAASSRRSRRGNESPDGKWTILVKDNNIVLRARPGGQELVLSRDGKPGDTYDAGQVWWSPDSQHFVAMRTEPAQEHKVYIVESSPKDQLQPKLKTLDYLKPGDRIAHPRPQLFSIAKLTQIPLKEDLYPNPWNLDDIRWDADSSRFTFLYNQRGHQALRLIAVEAATGQARPLINETSDTFICYSGKSFWRWIGEAEILWMSERDGWNHLWLIDARTGLVKNQITRGQWVVQSVVHVDEAKRQIWFHAGGIIPGQDPYYTHFARVNFDGTGLTVLTEGDGTHKVQWKPGESCFIDTWSRVDQPPVHELRRSDTGKKICTFEEADASEILAWRNGRWPVRFVAKGRDGQTDIYGVIFLPRSFDESRKYPVIEQIYAGPQGFFTPKVFNARPRLQQLADRGAILVQCDGMGTSGRSKKFHDVCFQNLRDSGLPDRIAWIKSAAKQIPQMDLSRVGIYGGSAGGQSTVAALLWHNDFYKVGVADCGCHDNRMDKIWWNEQWMGWPVGRHYAENSNAANAHRLEGKLMLIVGELDSNVDPASTMQVAGALQKADKDFELVVIVGAGHGAAETPYGTKKRTEFLLRNLGVEK